MTNMMQTGDCYQGPMTSPPRTPSSGFNFFHPKSGHTNPPPLIPGYFTPPDSRENSPSLGGTSPSPQDDNAIPQQFAPNSPSPSGNGATYNSRKKAYGSWLATTSPSIIQEEESFSNLQSSPEKTKTTISPVFQISGFQHTHGTFGRADSRLYQKNTAAGSSSKPPKPNRSPNHRHQKSNVSTIAPLPSTVYVPGVGDIVSSTTSVGVDKERHHYHSHRRKSSVSDPTAQFPSSYYTPPPSATSPSIFSPFIPLKPDTPAIPVSQIPQQYRRNSLVSSQAELIGLWKSAKRNGKPVRNPVDSGRTYVLNMYRQPSLQTPRNSNHPLVSPEHFTFGPNTQTPFYTMHAVRENSDDDTFNELSFLRRDPISGLDTSIIALGLEPPSRRLSLTGDGLIALVYPKEAVLSAMTPATPIVQDNTSETPNPLIMGNNEERTREAIQRAYATECCRLSWNAQRRRYYLYHPGAADGGDAYLVEIEGEVGFDHLDANGTIKLINVDTNETFTELNFSKNKLFVNTCATLKIPSDHMVDVAVATILTVATVEGRRVRTVLTTQSQLPTPTMSRHVDREHGEKKRRGCFSAFLKSLGL